MTYEEREQLEDDLASKIADVLNSYLEEKHPEDSDTSDTIVFLHALVNVLVLVLDRAAVFDELETAYNELMADVDVTIRMVRQMAADDREQRKMVTRAKFKLIVNNERPFVRNRKVQEPE
jgi:hypothetical protein